MPYVQKIGLALEVACIVEGLHRHGVVHADLKPENFLVADDGSLRVCDFGCAHLVSNGPSISVQRCCSPLS